MVFKTNIRGEGIHPSKQNRALKVAFESINISKKIGFSSPFLWGRYLFLPRFLPITNGILKV